MNKKSLLVPVLSLALACAMPGKKGLGRIDQHLDGTEKDENKKTGEVEKASKDWRKQIELEVELQRKRGELAWALSECMRDTIEPNHVEGKKEYVLTTTPSTDGISYEAKVEEDSYAMGQIWKKDLVTVEREIPHQRIRDIIFPIGGRIYTARTYQDGKLAENCHFFAHRGDSDLCSFKVEKNYESIYGEALVDLMQICHVRRIHAGKEEHEGILPQDPITWAEAEQLVAQEKAIYSEKAVEGWEIEQEYIKDIQVMMDELARLVDSYQPVQLSEMNKQMVRKFMKDNLWNERERDQRIYEADPPYREIIEKFSEIPGYTIGYGIYDGNRFRIKWLNLAIQRSVIYTKFDEKRLTTGWFTEEEEEMIRKDINESIDDQKYLKNELAEELKREAATGEGRKFVRDPNSPDYLPNWDPTKEIYRKKRQGKQ